MRKELLNQTSMDIDSILDIEGGQQFVAKLVRDREGDKESSFRKFLL